MGSQERKTILEAASAPAVRPWTGPRPPELHWPSEGQRRAASQALLHELDCAVKVLSIFLNVVTAP